MPDPEFEKFRIASHLVVWHSLGKECQEQARLAFWTSKDPDTRDGRNACIELIARHHRFRPKFVHQASFEKKDDWVQPLFRKTDGFLLLSDFIRAWLTDNKRSLVYDYLDAVGLAHSDGYLKEICEAPDGDRIEVGVQEMLEKHDRHDVGIYLCFLALMSDIRHQWITIWNSPTATALMGEILDSGDVPPDPQVRDEGPSQSDDEGLNPAQPSIEVETKHSLPNPADQTSPSSGMVEAPRHASQSATPTDRFQDPEGEDLTTLDNHLIFAAVATAVQEEGAHTEDQLEDLIEEVVDLNAGRHRSLFHRGFFHSLFKKEAHFHFAGENSQRRQWYLLGYLFGLLRRNEIPACIKILTEDEKELGRELAESHQTACGKKLLPQLCQALLESGHLKFTLSMVAHQFRRLDESNATRVAEALYGFASRRLREGHPGEAEEILDLLLRFGESEEGSKMEALYRLNLSARAARRKAQSLQARGAFPEARHLLTRLITSELMEPPVGAFADLGLIEGGFRSLASILPRAGRNENKELLHSLKKGQRSFEDAVARDERQATNAHAALGVILTLEGKPDTAQARVDHLRTALGGMAEAPESYASGGIQDWAEFLLTLALLETTEPGNSVPANDLLPAIIKTQTRFPVYLWLRMLEASAIFDDNSIGMRIVEHLLTVRQEVASLLSSAHVFSEKRGLLETVLDRYLKLEIPVKARWQTLHTLLRETLKSRHPDVAGTILDSLEGIALKEKEFRSPFADLLENSNNYSPAWDSDDATDSRSYLLEIEGRFDDAAALLRDRFYREKAEGQPDNIIAARAIIERIRDFRGACLNPDDLEKLLPSDEVGTPLSSGLKGHILYIGGNETQAAYLPRLRQDIYRDHPELEVEYYLPGWDSNWHLHLAKLKPLVDWADVVVINSFVRTQLGRHLRQYCGREHPWRPCTGRGLESLKRSILQAAAWRRTLPE